MKWLFALLLLLPNIVLGAGSGELSIEGDSVIVYSGPSHKFRPLFVANKGERFPVAFEKVGAIDEAGDFYKVLINLKFGNKKRIGYIFGLDPVRMVATSGAQEDLDAYEGIALSRTSLVINFHTLQNKTYQLTAGYLFYPTPNLFLKAFGGQVLTVTRGSLVAGAEVGVEHYLSSRLSAAMSLGGGAVFSPNSDVLFVGSSKVDNTIQVHGGLRYNTGPKAALHFGVSEVSYFNRNSGVLVIGGYVGLEVGL